VGSQACPVLKAAMNSLGKIANHILTEYSARQQPVYEGEHEDKSYQCDKPVDYPLLSGADGLRIIASHGVLDATEDYDANHYYSNSSAKKINDFLDILH
jgi:hypothetical protein